MADNNTLSESELGRSSKSAASPKDHLMHLLNIGWNPRAPLIQKYAIDHGLTRDLEEYARELNKS
jgi:hypothetical protein